MYTIDYICASITNDHRPRREPTKKADLLRTLRERGKNPRLHRFRLLDDDQTPYFYGWSTTASTEAAFWPLDEVGAAYGCTIIEYRDERTGKYREL